MTFDKPIIIQKINEVTETWDNYFALHARVNKTTGSEYLGSGAIQSQSSLTFEVRYFPDLEKINYDRGSYRIKYRDRAFNIEDYDDYLETHKTVKLMGVSING